MPEINVSKYHLLTQIKILPNLNFNGGISMPNHLAGT
jgi:hypothetical protein